MTTTADIIKAYMLKRGYSQHNMKGKSYRSIARAIGISPIAFYRFLGNDLNLKEENLLKLCNLLDIDYPALMLIEGVLVGRFHTRLYAEGMDLILADLQGDKESV
jgi:transcriptional regulator with XRE-family HTH domain